MIPTAALFAAALLLVASHAVPSLPGVRPVLVLRFGRAGFIAVYSLLSAAALALFVAAYAAADTVPVFTPPSWAAPLAVALMPAVFVLLAARLSTPFGEAASPRPPRGIYRVTRCPGSVGLLLWAGLHLLATGDSRRLLLFATMAVIAMVAIVKNGRVLRTSLDEGAVLMRDTTMVVPFAALATGRQRLVWGEIGPWRVLAGLAAWGLMLAAHPHLFGVNPLFWLP